MSDAATPTTAPSRKILPDGRSRIHYCIRDPDGPIKVGPAAIQATNQRHTVQFPGHRFRMACAPHQADLIRLRFTDDVRAATCPECLESDDGKAALEKEQTESDEG